MPAPLPAWLATPTRTVPPRFRPRLQPLDDRITPAVTFAATTIHAAGDGAATVVLADFNGDGRADVAVANVISNDISVFRNTSSGATITLAAQQVFSVGAVPAGMVAADFNGDGRPDLATTSNAGDTVRVRLNTTPSGATSFAFAAAAAFAVGDAPDGAAVGDFNGDGRPDLAVANSGSDGVSVLLNTTPTGAAVATFSPAQNLAVGDQPSAVAVGDFNGDGRADLAVANFLDNTVSVRLNTAAVGAVVPAFAAQQTFAVDLGPNGIVAADFSGDGRADLATCNLADASSNVSVLRNTTAAGATVPAFAAPLSFAVEDNPESLSVADLDGDGRADVITANRGDVDSVSVLENTTPAGAVVPAFAARQTFALGANPQSAVGGDLDGDGRADLVAGVGGDDVIATLRNTTVGTTVSTPALVGQFGGTGLWGHRRASDSWSQLLAANANAVAVAPNGMVVASFGANGVSLYRPTGGWTLIDGIQARAVAIDGLGNVYASYAGFGTYVYRLATGNWTLLTGSVADKLAVAANGDLVGNFPGFGLYIYRPTTNWSSLGTPDAVALAVGANGDIAASFVGHGTYRYKAFTWTLINAYTATALAVAADGAVAASFPNFGTAKYLPHVNGWQSLSGVPASSVAMDLYGNVFVSFPGYGTYEFNPHYGWRLRRATAADFLGLG